MYAYVQIALRILRPVGFALFCSGLVACGGVPDPLDPVVNPTPSACSAPEGLMITDMQSVVDWINAMPKPLTLPCFTQSLPRPLKVYTSLGTVSAQPAIDSKRPRFFIFINNMTLSVVPGESYPTHVDGSPQDPDSTKYNQLELSQPTTGYLSIKGELRFPVRDTLPNAAPYKDLEYAFGYSICGLCHHYEKKIGSLDGISIFVSDRKMPRDAQNLAVAREEHKLCDRTADPYHCDMMAAIFDKGEVVWQDFPALLRGHF